MRAQSNAGWVAAVFVAISTFVVIQSFAADWPQHRGVDRNGISKEAGWLSTWPEEGPPLLWKRSMGCGFSSVAVVRTRLYTEGTVGEKTRVWCLDAATGKVVWQADNKIKTDAYGLAASPLILGEQVIVAAGGHLYLRGAKHLFCLEEGAK